MKKDGKEWTWCDHHMDGKGMYMPKGHDHEKWKTEKAERKKAWTEKRGKTDKEPTKSTT